MPSPPPCAALDFKAINPRGFGGQRPPILGKSAKLRFSCRGSIFVARHACRRPVSFLFAGPFGSSLFGIFEAVAISIALDDVTTMDQQIQIGQLSFESKEQALFPLRFRQGNGPVKMA